MEATRFEPPTSPEGEAFWAATREQRLVLPWCTRCEAPFWYPRATCPRCRGDAIDWRDASGAGRVHAVSVQHRPANPLMADRVPYAVALVDLREGVRLLSNLVDCDLDDATIGMEVEVAWEALSDGRHLPQFAPARA